MSTIKRQVITKYLVILVLLLVVPTVAYLVRTADGQAMATLEPKWAALREQYEPSVVAFTQVTHVQPVAQATLEPKWVALREQYEPSVVAFTQQHYVQPALEQDWAAVRQQYESTYAADWRVARMLCTTLAPEWIAVRQQYETAYTPQLMCKPLSNMAGDATS